MCIFLSVTETTFIESTYASMCQIMFKFSNPSGFDWAWWPHIPTYNYTVHNVVATSVTKVLIRTILTTNSIDRMMSSQSSNTGGERCDEVTVTGESNCQCTVDQEGQGACCLYFDNCHSDNMFRISSHDPVRLIGNQLVR